MPLQLSIELTDRDLAYFREALAQSRHAVRDADEAEIIDAVSQVLAQIRENEPLPDFVAGRLPDLELLLGMLGDTDWALPPADRERLLAVLVYFTDPEDILPDDVSVIGYLDDVIIIELVSREMTHVREAYAQFLRYRNSLDPELGDAQRHELLNARQRELQEAMQAAAIERSGVLG